MVHDIVMLSSVCKQYNNVNYMLRRKTVFRLIIWVTVVVIIWLLWDTTFDNSSTRFAHYDAARKSSELEYSKLDRNMLILPKNISLLTIPQIGVENDNVLTSSGKDVKSGLTFRNKSFYLNNQPFMIFSGAVHYFRIVPEYWEDRLKKLKACGLNTVETYVAWNLHEPSPGVFNFDEMLDLKHFITLAAKLGLYVIIRPGPFICSEFEFGGLPGWLLNDPNMKVRTNYPGYMTAVNRYFSVLLPMLHNLQFTEGGPIIMFQVENEYTVYSKDTQHLKMLVYLMKGYGVKELLVTSDHKFKDKYAEDKSFDFSKYALPTDNFDSPWSNSFSVISTLNNHFPMMVMEFWIGWFDFWGNDKHSITTAEGVNTTLDFIMSMGGSFNLYMFIGGTNFGFTSGANDMSAGYQPMVTSYDYDAALSEAGDITPKYTMIRKRLLQFYRSKGIMDLPAVPPDTPKTDYGSLKVSEMMEWDTLLSLLPIIVVNKTVDYMETYQDNYGLHSTLGYIIYSYRVLDTTHATTLFGTKLKGQVRDRLTAILNNQIFYVKDYVNKQENTFPHYKWDMKLQGQTFAYVVEHRNEYDYVLSEQNWRYVIVQKFQEIVSNILTKETHPLLRLHFLVENLGRVNYSFLKNNLFDQQRKGMSGQGFYNMSGDNGDWIIRFINFNSEQCQMVSESSSWTAVKKDIGRQKTKYETIVPRLYRAYLTITGSPNDTFIKLDGWTKGVVIVNHFNLGRYWHIGPQKTLYLPAPVLKSGRNEILIFEEIKRGNKIIFQNYPEL